MSESTALTKRSAESALMPPPPPPRRIKRPPKVLDEDKYTAALSHIIARDFFPGLLESETQQEYLDAIDSGDSAWVKDAGQRVRQAMTPVGQRGRRGVSMTPRAAWSGGETPRNFRGETPGMTPARKESENVQEEKDEQIDYNMSLSAFQAKYTSEDNESFNKVLDRQNETRASKYGWLYANNKLPSKQRLLQASIADRKLLTSGNDAGTSQALTLRPSQNQDARPASISAAPSTLSTTSQGPRNGFMFTPDDLADARPELTSRAEEAQSRSLAGPKSVTYGATRLPTSLHDEGSFDDDDTASLSLSAIDAAIRGQPRRRDLGSIADIGGGETPRVNGYAFVDAEPTPSELGIPETPESPLEDDLLKRMIESNAEHGGGGPNPFTINTSSAREDLHHRLVDKNLASKRKSSSRLDYLKASEGTGRTPTPKFASSPKISDKTGSGGKTKFGNMTPAARMLYHQLGSGSKTPVGGGGMFDGKEKTGSTTKSRGAWTPTPLRRKGA